MTPSEQIQPRPVPLRPAPLREGGLVRVVSPSLPSLAYARRSVDQALRAVEALGLRCDFSEHAFEITDDGLSAGTPEMRAHDLHQAFLAPEVDAVMAAMGGSTSREVLPLLDPELIRAHPKAFIGRSDNSYINAFLLEEVGLISYTGVAFLSQFGSPEQHQETQGITRAVLRGELPVEFRSSRTRTAGVRPWQFYSQGGKSPAGKSRPAQDAWLRQGAASGRLVGGEVSIVAELIGSGAVRADGCVLWLDVGDDGEGYVEHYVERIAEGLDEQRPVALLVSDCPWIPFTEWQESARRCLEGFPLREGAPVFLGGNMGHYQPAWLMPYGDIIEVDSRRGIVYGA